MIKRLILFSNAGVDENQTVLFNDKLIVRNHLALICAFFSTIYLFYFIHNNFVTGSICIFISIVFFLLSVLCNHLHYYNLSKAILILDTNFSVLFTSILFGFNSGFHLYLLTSPLITFMLFEPKQRMVIFLSILSYCVNFFSLILLYKYYNFDSPFAKNEQSNTMYLLNFTFTIFIIITLLLYYSNNNLKVNRLLNQNNEALILQQGILKTEINARKKTEEELVSLLSDKSMLVTEIHHRVKNNLAIISGLLELETSFVTDENTERVITENKKRIKSIALLHEQLYQNKNIGHINMQEYINLLKQNILSSHNLPEKGLTINNEIEAIELTMDFALPIALILNELILNSIKQNSEKLNNIIIDFTLKKHKNKISVSYSDNIPRNDQYESDFKKSFTYNLIEALVLQLNGEGKYEINNRMSYKMTI